MMIESPYNTELMSVADQLPQGLRLGIIGSTAFNGQDSQAICIAVGTQLAGLHDLVLITGGVTGVGETIGRAFVDARRNCPEQPTAYHLLPHGFRPWDYGVMLFVGTNMPERREILARLASVYLVIEGGGGTAHEAQIAQAQGAIIIPVGRTGGCAQDLYRQIQCPDPRLQADWQTLNDRTVTIDQVAGAVQRIVASICRSCCALICACFSKLSSRKARTGSVIAS